MEMHAQVEKYEQTMNPKKNQETKDQSNGSVDGGVTADGGRANVNNDEVDQPVYHVIEPTNRHPYQISLRSRAEEDIVNDAKRKRIMLHMCEQPVSGEEINCSPYSIAHLKGLRSLNLASCNRISDVSLKYAFKFNELEVLSLAKCQQVSVTGIECIVVTCPSIKVLNLSDCHNLSDQAIDVLTRLKRLTYLHIERCSQLTDFSLDSIALNCKRLKYLDVRGCRAMCSEPSLRLENLRSLQRILMSKPGPYIQTTGFGKQPKAPPMPSSF